MRLNPVHDCSPSHSAMIDSCIWSVTNSVSYEPDHKSTELLDSSLPSVSPRVLCFVHPSAPISYTSNTLLSTYLSFVAPPILTRIPCLFVPKFGTYLSQVRIVSMRNSSVCLVSGESEDTHVRVPSARLRGVLRGVEVFEVDADPEYCFEFDTKGQCQQSSRNSASERSYRGNVLHGLAAEIEPDHRVEVDPFDLV